MSISYILPVKWEADQDAGVLTDYLKLLSLHTDLIIIDGSTEECFQAHNKVWGNFGRHIRPHSDMNFLNGKVNGVLTGLREAKNNCIIIGDDDVRYTADQIREMETLLKSVQMVVPQNYFDPSPWHAKWDTARSLLNRSFSNDYLGTLGIQRDFVNKLGGYDGNVLFENLELIRTVRAGKGKILYRDDMYIQRLPPTAKHFWSQRIRQAYDDYAQPLRWFFFIFLIPVLVILVQYSFWFVIAIVLASVLVAEAGRRKSGGSKVFSPFCSFFAPVWLLERSICTWLALSQKIFHGGCRYGRVTIIKAANPLWKISKGFKRDLSLQALRGAQGTAGIPKQKPNP